MQQNTTPWSSFVVSCFISLALHQSGVMAVPISINGEVVPSEFPTSTTFINEVHCFIGNGSLQGNDLFPLLTTTCSFVEIFNASFSHGFNTEFGGCVLLHNVTTIIIRDSYFEGCSSRMAGGAIAVFPFDSVRISVIRSKFFNTSVFLSGGLTNETAAAAGGAFFFRFSSPGNASSFHFEDVVFDSVQQGFESDIDFEGSTSYPFVIGGTIVALWLHRNSGNGVVATLQNVSFCDSLTAVELSSKCTNLSKCPVSAMSLLLFWASESSGNDLTIVAANLSFRSLTLNQGLLPAVGFGPLWRGSESGHRMQYSLTSVRLEDSYIAAFGTFFSWHWVGTSSGSSALVEMTGEIELVTSFLGSGAVQMKWGDAFSGFDSCLKLTGAFFRIDQCSLNFGSNIVSMEFSGPNSAENITLSVFASSVDLVEVTLAFSSLFSIEYQSCDGVSAFLKQSTVLVVDSSLMDASSLLKLWGLDSIDVCFRSTVIVHNCNITLQGVSLLDESTIFAFWWWFVASLQTLMNISDTDIKLMNCSLMRSNMIDFYWFGSNHARNSSTLLLERSKVKIINSTSTLNATMFNAYQPPPNLMVEITSPFILINSSIQSIVDLYSTMPLQETDLTLRDIYLENSSVLAIVQQFLQEVISCSVSILHVCLVNSDTTGVVLNIIPSAKSGRGRLSVIVRDVNGTDSAWIAVSVTAPNSQLMLSLAISISEQFLTGGSCQFLSLYAPASAFLAEALVSNSTVTNAAAQLAFVEGIGGALLLSSIELSHCTVHHSLVSVLLYSGVGVSSNLSLDSLFVSSLSVAPDALGLEVVGSVTLLLTGKTVIAVQICNSSRPIISLEKSVHSPRFVAWEPNLLELTVMRYGVPGCLATSASLLSFPNSGPGLTGYFVSSFEKEGGVESYSITYRRAQSLQCPPGYTFGYQISIYRVYYEPYTVPPVNCLDRSFDKTAFSCDRLTFSATVSCTPCSVGYISFYRGDASTAVVTTNDVLQFEQTTESLTRCMPCPSSFLCESGPADATIVRQHWTLPLGVLWQANDWGNASLSDLVLRCVSDACDPETPLTYRSGEVVEGSLCSPGRDPSSTLCSLCLPNSSASVFSGECAAGCTWGYTQALLISLAVGLGAGFIAYLLLRRLTPQSAWIRIVSYYFSVITLLYSSSDISERSIIVHVAASFATLGVVPSGISAKSFCLPGTQPIDIFLAQFLLPLFLLFTFIMAVAVRFVVTKEREYRRLAAGGFSILLLSYSSIAGAVFAFLPCVDVPIVGRNGTSIALDTRQFQHAEWSCWSTYPETVVLIVLGLVCVFGFPLGLFVWQSCFPSNIDRLFYGLLRRFRRNETVRRSPRTSWKGVGLLFLIEGNLKDRRWYWDAFLLVRRAVLELVSVFASRGLSQQLWLSVLNILFFALHVAALPYLSPIANFVDAVSLFALSIVSLLNLPSTFIDAVPTSLTPFVPFLSSVKTIQGWIAFVAFLFIVFCVLSVYLVRLVKSIRRLQTISVNSCERKGRSGKSPSSCQLKSIEEPLMNVAGDNSESKRIQLNI